MADLVLGDSLIDHLARNQKMAKIMPACFRVLQAGWVQNAKGCRSCGKKRKGTTTMDPNARNRFKRCLLKASPDDIARLKRLLQVERLIISDRSEGNLKTVKL